MYYIEPNTLTVTDSIKNFIDNYLSSIQVPVTGMNYLMRYSCAGLYFVMISYGSPSYSCYIRIGYFGEICYRKKSNNIWGNEISVINS